MRIVSIVGARPQFIKMAMICRAAAEAGVEHRIIHTGQHYDRAMSDVFFEELQIPSPDYNLAVGSGDHGEQTGEMMKRLEPVLKTEQPDWVVLYGDTNSTMAGAVVASKLGLRVAHVEAGLRSFNRRMPEELNRIVADHLSDVLFCPTHKAVQNVAAEGLQDHAVLTGDVMYDAVLLLRKVAESRASPVADAWGPGTFALATVHRAENTDDRRRLRAILQALSALSATLCPVLLPLHPRTRNAVNTTGLSFEGITVIEPVSYLEMLLLESRARVILTDSGGVQKEAYFFQTPCVTLRAETEWVETLGHRCNTLADVGPETILKAALESSTAGPWAVSYGNGDASDIIVRDLLSRSRRARDTTATNG